MKNLWHVTVVLAAAIGGMLEPTVVQAGQASAAAAIQIDLNGTAVICTACQPRVARFLVRPPDGKSLPVVHDDPQIVQVAIDGVQQPDQGTNFTAHWEKAKSGCPVALVVTVKDGLRRAATYQLALDLLPGRSAPTRAVVSVTIPEAKLDVPASFAIEQMVNFPWDSPVVDERAAKLRVRETAGQTDVSAIAGETGAFVVDDKSISGHVTIDPSRQKGPLKANGDSLELAYALTGDFPLGVAKGQLLLRADEVKAAVPIPIEVRTRLRVVYLFLGIAVGLAMSWYLKVWLAKWIQLSQARALAATLLQNITQDHARYAEARFWDPLQPLMTGLQQAAQGKDAAAIDTNRTDLDTAWRAAAQTAEADRADYKAKAERFQQVVTRDWRLPTVLRGPVTDARASAQRCVTVLNPDIDARRAQLGAAQDTLADHLRKEGRAWHVGTLEAFTSIATGEPARGLPANVSSSLATAAASWPTTYPVPWNLPDVVTADLLDANLRSTAGLYLAAGEAVDRISTALPQALDDANVELKPVSMSLATVATRIPVVVERLKLLPDDPSHVDAVRGALRELDQAWRLDFEPVVAAVTDQAKRDPIVIEFEAQQFVKAARDCAREIRAAAAASGAKSAFLGGRGGGGRGGGPGAAAPQTEAAMSLLAAPMAPLQSQEMRALSAPISTAPFVTLLLESESDLRTAKAWQSVGVGLLLVVYLFGNQYAGWDGTWVGVSKGLFAGLGIDFAAEAILAKLKG